MRDSVKKALPLIKEFEGFRSKPYLCSANVPTIGYGSATYENGAKVTLNDDPIDEARASRMLAMFVGKHSDLLEAWMVKFLAPKDLWLNVNQQAAILSFTYNLGFAAFKNSTFSKRIIKNDPFASEELLKWVIAGGKRLEGLVRRRKQERELFDSAVF